MRKGKSNNMEGIRERYDKSLRKRANGSEDSSGEGNRDCGSNDNREIDLLVRWEEDERKEENWEGSSSKSEANNADNDDVAEGKKEEGIATNTEPAVEEV